MQVIATKRFRDARSGEVRDAGSLFDVSEERFAEINSAHAGLVVPVWCGIDYASPGDCDASSAAADVGAPACVGAVAATSREEADAPAGADEPSEPARPEAKKRGRSAAKNR